MAQVVGHQPLTAEALFSPMGFVVLRIAMGQVSFGVLWFFPPVAFYQRNILIHSLIHLALALYKVYPEECAILLYIAPYINLHQHNQACLSEAKWTQR